MRIMCEVHILTAGKIYCDGVSSNRHNCGYILQQRGLTHMCKFLASAWLTD